jgi:hypothetical protein
VTDESVVALSTPFPIYFNNNILGYSNIFISTNGVMSFTNSNSLGTLNRPLPTNLANTIVAPYWDDLVPLALANSNVYIATTGSVPNRRFVIEWRNLRHYSSIGSGTFQAIFYENSSDIRFNYLDTNFSNTAVNFGASATIGIQSTPLTATQYSFNTPLIPGSFSLFFRLL